MANPKILYQDLSAVTFSSSVGTNASYPVTNLKNYIATSYWSGSAVTAGQRLIIDLGVDTAVTTVIIDGHNFTGCGADQSVKIQYATDANFTTGVTNWSGDIAQADDTTVSTTAATTTKRYWAIIFNSSVPLTVPPRIGNIFIGTPLEFTTPYDYGYRTENAEYITTQKTSLNGITRTSQMYKGRIVYELTFNTQDNTLRSGYQTFVRTVRGKMFPFYFIDDDGTTRYMHMTSDYSPVVTTQYGQNNIETLAMKTQQSTY